MLVAVQACLVPMSHAGCETIVVLILNCHGERVWSLIRSIRDNSLETWYVSYVVSSALLYTIHRFCDPRNAIVRTAMAAKIYLTPSYANCPPHSPSLVTRTTPLGKPASVSLDSSLHLSLIHQLTSPLRSPQAASSNLRKQQHSPPTRRPSTTRTPPHPPSPVETRPMAPVQATTAASMGAGRGSNGSPILGWTSGPWFPGVCAYRGFLSVALWRR